MGPEIVFRVVVPKGPNRPVPNVNQVAFGAFVTVPLKETTELLAQTDGVTPAVTLGKVLGADNVKVILSETGLHNPLLVEDKTRRTLPAILSATDK